MTWWPGWNSIEGAAKWGDIFFWAGFAFLALLVGCEVLSKVYAWHKDALIAVRDDMVVAAADTRTRQAQQELEEAQQARQEARQAREEAMIAAAERARAAEAEKTELAAPPMQEEHEAQPQATTDPLARSSEQVARLQERSPRGLTEAQKKSIVGLLSAFHGQKFSVVCIAGDAEGKSIAQELVTVLRAAGWDFPESGVAEATYNKEPIGLSLMVNAGQITTPSVLRPVAMLVKALADAGLMQRNGALADPNIARDRIEIRVGRNRGPS
jgi:hypothetical protein